MLINTIGNILIGFLFSFLNHAGNGTSFPIEKTSDIVWSIPKGFKLTLDVYTPKTGKKNYPVIIVFHGGGWLIHGKESMSSASEYLASTGEYVVCNVNCRKLGDLGNSVKMNEIIEDAMGAVLWVKENISKYEGDPDQVVLTGDSAGAHMIASVILMKNRLGQNGFDGVHFEYKPTYIPPGKSLEIIKTENLLEVQAALFSYGIFDLLGAPMNRFETYMNPFWTLAKLKPRGIFGDAINAKAQPNYYKAVSPLHAVEEWKGKKLPPMFFAVGSRDLLTTPKSIQVFMNQLKRAGHTKIDFWVHKGRTHGYLDSEPNFLLGNEFKEDGVPALDRMLLFLAQLG